MSLTDLQGIAEHVINRARVQGFVVPREIRATLAEAGWPENQWKDVLALAQAFLHFRQGRYYYVSVVSTQPRQDQLHQRDIQQAVRQIIRDYKVKTAEFRSSSPPKSLRPITGRFSSSVETFLQPASAWSAHGACRDKRFASSF